MIVVLKYFEMVIGFINLGDLRGIIKKNMPIYRNILSSLKNPIGPTEIDLFQRFCKIDQNYMTAEGQDLRSHVKAMLAFGNETQKLGIVTSVQSNPATLVKMCESLAKAGGEKMSLFLNSHIFSLTNWCVARISNPKEEVPGNVKAIMLIYPLNQSNAPYYT